MTEGFFILPHAQKRMQSRGITREMVTLTLRYGKKMRARDSLYYFFGKRSLPEKMTLEMRRMADRLEGLTLIFDPEGTVLITCFKNKNFPKKIKPKLK